MTPEEAKKIVLAECPGLVEHIHIAWGQEFIAHTRFGRTTQIGEGFTVPEAWINAAENIKERK